MDYPKPRNFAVYHCVLGLYLTGFDNEHGLPLWGNRDDAQPFDTVEIAEAQIHLLQIDKYAHIATQPQA